jgi:hypothetical protein
MGVFPILFYLTCFFLLTYPALLKFNTHYFNDAWDGLHYVWNLWWIDKSITQLHQLPWYTEYRYYPSGTTLLGHDLNPLNGFIGILLLRFTGLLQTYNTIFLLAFLLGGLNAFFLAYYFSRSFWGSLLAGYIFTFSSYHFAHAGGHLSLISLQWIPLFILCWYVLLTRPSVVMALLASLTLLLVALSNYYYAFYAVLAGIILFLGHMLRARDPFFFLQRPYLLPLTVFILATVVTSGALAAGLLVANAKDPLVGGHLSKDFSLDLLAPVIHGGHWRFSALTKPYWSSVDLKIDESSVHLGVSVIILLIYVFYVWLRRRVFSFPGIGIWYFILIFFALLSLGPVLQVWGKEITSVKLPYALLERLPGLALSGVPARMIVITLLAAAVICAVGFSRLLRLGLVGRSFALLLAALLVVEYLPSTPHGLPTPIWTSQIAAPEYVAALKALSPGGSVLDLTARNDLDLYYQTIHDKPIALGSMSRVPASLFFREGELKALVAQGNLISLHKQHSVRYLVTPTQICPGSSADCPSIKLMYQDTGHWVYDLSP